jgi:hypothetical protein
MDSWSILVFARRPDNGEVGLCKSFVDELDATHGLFVLAELDRLLRS